MIGDRTMMARVSHMAALAVLGPMLLGMGGLSMQDTRHNLSVTGPGDVKSDSEDEVCVFCHISHSEEDAAVGPLWSRGKQVDLGYQPYESSTLAARATPNLSAK